MQKKWLWKKKRIWCLRFNPNCNEKASSAFPTKCNRSSSSRSTPQCLSQVDSSSHRFDKATGRDGRVAKPRASVEQPHNSGTEEL